MATGLAFRNGQFIPASDLSISIHDTGFVLGTTVAERVRTYGGELFAWAEHLARLRESLAIVAVNPGFDDTFLTQAAQRLVENNRTSLPDDSDLSLCLFVTPGERGTPLVVIYTEEVAFATFASLYRGGQRLITSRIRQTSPENWPPQLKCRSRMHYYLADHEVRQIDPASRALLLSLDGLVTEASTANVMLHLPDEGIVSPRRETVLPGISLQVTERLAGRLGMAFTYRDIRPDELSRADEIFLCSTSPGILPVVMMDGQAVGSGAPGEVFGQLLSAWNEHVGLDIVAQALRFGGAAG
ncbi:MAG: aminotransferase class IV [Planctomycetales bacterium]|nr:aminotransferase class IV [Planctomycetales bacterium]